MSGKSQAVRIPDKYRLTEDKVFISKVGDTLMITPIKDLASSLEKGASMISDDFTVEDGMLESLDLFTDDFMSNRVDVKPEEREAL